MHEAYQNSWLHEKLAEFHKLTMPIGATITDGVNITAVAAAEGTRFTQQNSSQVAITISESGGSIEQNPILQGSATSLARSSIHSSIPSSTSSQYRQNQYPSGSRLNLGGHYGKFALLFRY